MAVIDPAQRYTYRQYFDLKIDAIDLAQYFGYRFVKAPLELQEYVGELGDDITNITTKVNRVLPRLVNLNEQIKREMLVAPVIESVIHWGDAQLRAEYDVNVSFQLQGTVDYLISAGNLAQVLVVEAKRDDLDYGVSQLIAEMIALDQWERSPSVEQQGYILGALTIGTLWQFAWLDRHTKLITQGLEGYRVPQELEKIMRILVWHSSANPV